MTAIYQRLLDLLKERDTNINQLCLKIQVNPSTVRSWANASPSSDNIIKVANVLNVSTDWLLTGVGFALNPPEEALLESFRALGSQNKRTLLKIAQVMGEEEREKNESLLSNELLTSNKNDGNIILCYVFNAA